ncbi:MAG: thiol reductant ABC exporter subunit CydC, partial [Actinobacteria bacterium]|nr:thiol reductant ABC exporter subunit CydC [Actinomycetota bacterium]MCG2801358.1 thiol reductant ABC exporter subunit CydC [Cellulomonas sp.]
MTTVTAPTVDHPTPRTTPTTAIPSGTLRRALRLLGVNRMQVAASIAVGTLALGSAIGLAAVSAWLIARASQMPPVMTLSVAAVSVRAFGISRGVLRYVERLISHDLALRGMTTLRTTLYARLADGRAEAVLRVRRGDLLARVGADVDSVGDLVVRGLVPAGVALVLGLGSSLIMGLFWPPAGIALALALVLAGVVSPVLTSRGVRSTERHAAEARAAMTATALGILDDAGPLVVTGRAGDELARLARQDARIAAAVDAGARPTALAAGIGVLAQGVAVLVALVTGIPAVRAGLLAPVELAVVVLTPLAAFEATSVLPMAAVQVQRSRAAAARILALLDSTGTPDDGAVVIAEPDRTAVARQPLPRPLVAQGLACGWSDGPAVLTGIDLELGIGRSVAVVGPSGVGKTTLLLTLAGLLPPKAGR